MKLKPILLMAIATTLLTACGMGNGDKPHADETPDASAVAAQRPLNISIFLDLSDRLTRGMTPSQKDRDLELVGFIADYFKSQTLGPKILESKNHIKVLFYPTPSDPDINTLASALSVDIAALNGRDKRVALEQMKDTFRHHLSGIYDKTIADGKWTGCDIWDFFNSKSVDQQCIRPGARNILFILTDGYLFHKDHKIKEGTAYSYILPATLAIPNSSLIARRTGLDDLEVCILEVNAYDVKHRDRIFEILENWLKEMGVKEEHITVANTDLPANTKTIIDRFLNH